MTSTDQELERTVKRRAYSYWAVAVGLGLCAVLLRDQQWQSSAEFHTALETVATLLALFVGVLALVRYYSKQGNTFLFIGAGFLGTAFLDGYHAVVTSMAFRTLMPSALPSLIPWSWVASRLFLSILLCLSWLAGLREDRLGAAGRYSSSAVYAVMGLFTMASFVLFAFAPLPPAYHAEWFFHRPVELVPGLFSLLALYGYLAKGSWRQDPFEHWLVLSLIVGIAGQSVFMPFSHHLFDFDFDAAHTLKKLSYVCVIVGLLISMRSLFGDAHESEARIAAILETAADAIITIDTKGTVQSVNRSAESIFGYARAELVGRNVNILMQSPDRERHDRYLSQFLLTRKTGMIGTPREVQGRRKDGTGIPIELEVHEMQLGDRTHYVGSCRDITERKQAELRIVKRTKQLEAANAELDSFAYSVSHDLRAPIRATNGFSQALLEDHGESLDASAKSYLERISRASRRMGEMVDDILTLSRTSRLELRMEDVDVSAIAQELLVQLQDNDRSRKVCVTVEPSLHAHADPKLLRVVLDNLLRNAWKFTGRKDSPCVEFGSRKQNGERVYFVRDNGAGFDMAYADKLFGIFQRLHSVREFDGTGVGLAMVARLLGRHGGRVWGEGAVDQGATFYFTLDSTTGSRPS